MTRHLFPICQWLSFRAITIKIKKQTFIQTKETYIYSNYKPMQFYFPQSKLQQQRKILKWMSYLNLQCGYHVPNVIIMYRRMQKKC